jgi:hypothetical protein
VHPARHPQFAHGGVYDIDTGTAGFPFAGGVIFIGPGEIFPFAPPAPRFHLWVVEEEVMGKIAPDDLFARSFMSWRVAGCFQSPPNRAGRNLTHGEVVGQLSNCVRQAHLVAVICIARCRAVEKSIELVQRRLFTRRYLTGQSIGGRTHLSI